MKPIFKMLIIGGLCSFLQPSASAERLVILHTNDTHSQIDPGEDGLGGVARRKALVDSVRAVEENVILVDAGDVVQGSLFFNLYRGEVEEKLMNALGYQVRILGNHEFDNGMESLAENLMKSDAVLLCSNYDTRNTPLRDVFQPWAFQEIDGKRIAFLPINLQPEGMISPRNTEGLRYIDAVETANKTAWYLKNIEDMDYVVAITHIGNGPDKDLARATSDIDVIIGGHSHTLVDPANGRDAYVVKNAAGKDVIVAQTGRYGKYVGEIAIDTDHLDALPEYQLLKVDSRLDAMLDPQIEAIVAPYRAAIDSLNSNYIATVSKDMPRESMEALNFMADFVYNRAKQLTDVVDLSIVNKGGIRNDIFKGQLSEGKLTSTFPFFNKIMVIEISGDSLIAAFDSMAAANGNGVSANVDAVYDPVADKCLEVAIDGKPIDPAKRYRVATIDYLAQGGDYMHSLADHVLVAESPKYLFDDFVAHYANAKGKAKKINPDGKRRMRPAKK